MGNYESAHQFQDDMQERLPVLANIEHDLKQLGARVFDSTTYTAELLHDTELMPSDRAALVSELFAESVSKIFDCSEDGAEHSANWEITHPLWSDEAYGYIYHEKTPNWELFDIACTPIVLLMPDEDTMMSLQIEIDHQEIRVLVEGVDLDFTRDKEVVQNQYSIISYILASMQESTITETTSNSFIDSSE